MPTQSLVLTHPDGLHAQLALPRLAAFLTEATQA